MGNTPTAKELVEEGRQALARGDRARALASFTLATQLDPNDETLWLLRSEATSDPADAAQCLEQVLKLNPDNAQANERLLNSRLGSLQQQARQQTDDSRKRRGLGSLQIPALGPIRGRVWVPTTILLACAALILGFVSALALNPSPGPAAESIAEVMTPTIAVLQLPPTWTPTPTQTTTPTPSPKPTPEWKATRNVTVRSGPASTFRSLGIMPQGTTLIIVGKSQDTKFVQIQYAEGKLGWIETGYVSIGSADLAALPVVATATTAISPPGPAPKPAAALTPTVIPHYDYILGRPPQYISDCSRPWKVLGTVYESRSSGKSMNGVLVRIWTFGRLQGTISSGSHASNMPGYWEWPLSPYSDVMGQIAIVNPDGTQRSERVSFHLTARCDGAGAVNQIVIDMAGNP